MKNTYLLGVRLLSLLCLLLTLSSGCYANLIPPDNKNFSYQGRIFLQDSKPMIAWQSSSIKINFTGKELSLGFSDTEGQVFFDLTVDEKTHILEIKNGWLSLPLELKEGKHQLTLYKRSEASGGTVRFNGIKIGEKEKVFKPATTKNKKQFIFYGDSITVGACNEDGNADQWQTRKTHNSAKSYAAFVANTFNADYQNIAISGIGISMGYQPYTVDQVWNRRYADPNAPLADLKQFRPDVVFVNYGENDDSFSKHVKKPFPKDWESRYLDFLKELRNTYPISHIVILRGGMWGGKKASV